MISVDNENGKNDPVNTPPSQTTKINNLWPLAENNFPGSGASGTLSKFHANLSTRMLSLRPLEESRALVTA